MASHARLKRLRKENRRLRRMLDQCIREAKLHHAWFPGCDEYYRLKHERWCMRHFGVKHVPVPSVTQIQLGHPIPGISVEVIFKSDTAEEQQP